MNLLCMHHPPAVADEGPTAQMEGPTAQEPGRSATGSSDKKLRWPHRSMQRPRRGRCIGAAPRGRWRTPASRRRAGAGGSGRSGSMQLIHASWPSKGAGGSVTFLYKSGCGIETRNLPDSFKKKRNTKSGSHVAGCRRSLVSTLLCLAVAAANYALQPRTTKWCPLDGQNHISR
jgi:hypothetical protein